MREKVRYSKRYVVFTLLLVLALILKFANFKGVTEEIGQFRGADLQSSDWNPLIAKSINEKNLTVAIDNKVYTNKHNGIYMDENLNLMVPLDLIRDSYNCSVHLYDDTALLIEKYSDSLWMSLDDQEVRINDEKEKFSSTLTRIDDRYYVPAEVIASKLGYSYAWDVNKNEAVVVNTSSETSILPSHYDLRERGRAPQVKNQGNKGTCWAASSLAALESMLLPEENDIFSTDNMSLGNSFGLGQNDGGEYTMSLAYLTAWQGPVLEKDDPYDGELTKNLAPVKHVQEAQIIESKDLEKIKEAVFKYGAVETSIYSTLQNVNSRSEYFNQETNSYCYVGSEKPNHDVAIIGWDDSYAKENFPGDLEGDGAFICQNSWGKDFGDNGVFYVSYYDTNVGIHNLVYTGVEDTDNYDTIYQSDLCGWVGQLGYNRDTIYGANVYTAENNENLEAAGFYATGKNTEYEVYVVKDYDGRESLSKRQKVASGKFDNAGFYTVTFDKKIAVDKGEKFAIVLMIKTPDSVHPMAIEYKADETTRNVDLSDGEGYISTNGKNWENVEETQSANLCIKAYAKEIREHEDEEKMNK